MNEHEIIKEKLALAAAGSLDPAEYRQIQQHTAQCDACRQELDNWSLYTQGLQRLPQPPIPAGLVERTQAQMLAVHAVAAAQKSDARASAWTLGSLTVFGWVASIAFWNVVEAFTGVDALTGFLASTVLVWITAGAAVVLFRHDGKTENV